MVKQSELNTVQVVLFVESETDEVFFKALIDYYRAVSTTEWSSYSSASKAA